MVRFWHFVVVVIALGILPGVRAQNEDGASSDQGSRIATLDPSDLRDFDTQPAAVRRLLTEALRLTKLNLAYKYGSSDPSTGGMDCSGTIYYLLAWAGVTNAPRDSSEIYRWAWTHGHVEPVVSSNPETFELVRMKPGDLMFWSGTYHVTRDPPVTHVMIYLGINRNTGRRVMVGASEGRRFNDVSRYGVSVFDFEMPRAGGDSRFLGYATIPRLGLNER